jgi:hypothetical protein
MVMSRIRTAHQEGVMSPNPIRAGILPTMVKRPERP